jgi:hypothetical protein
MYVVTYGAAIRFSIGNVRQPASTFEEKSRRMPSFAFSRRVPFSTRLAMAHRQRRRENDEGAMAAVAPAAGETAHRRAPPGAGPAVSGLTQAGSTRFRQRWAPCSAAGRPAPRSSHETSRGFRFGAALRDAELADGRLRATPADQ